MILRVNIFQEKRLGSRQTLYDIILLASRINDRFTPSNGYTSFSLDYWKRTCAHCLADCEPRKKHVCRVVGIVRHFLSGHDWRAMELVETCCRVMVLFRKMFTGPYSETMNLIRRMFIGPWFRNKNVCRVMDCASETLCRAMDLVRVFRRAMDLAGNMFVGPWTS